MGQETNSYWTEKKRRTEQHELGVTLHVLQSTMVPQIPSPSGVKLERHHGHLLTGTQVRGDQIPRGPFDRYNATKHIPKMENDEGNTQKAKVYEVVSTGVLETRPQA